MLLQNSLMDFFLPPNNSNSLVIIRIEIKIMAAFPGMHVSPAKHRYAWLPRKCDYLTDRHTDPNQSDPHVPLCFVGDTKMTSSALRLGDKFNWSMTLGKLLHNKTLLVIFYFSTIFLMHIYNALRLVVLSYHLLSLLPQSPWTIP